FFFFSSRRRHTRFSRDWSSDVCSSDLGEEVGLLYPYYYNKLFYDGLKQMGEEEIISLTRAGWIGIQRLGALVWSGDIPSTFEARSEERRVGKECRSRWSRCHDRTNEST